MEKALNVLYQSSDYYAPITGVSITSLLINNQDIDEINIYILDDNISLENQKKIKLLCKKYHRKLFLINTKKILTTLKKNKVVPFRNSYTTYLKLLAFKKIKINTDKILYLDSDTIINGSLSKLININLKNSICAATYDCVLNNYKKIINIPENDKYYNGGVLLINQKKWKSEKCEEQIIKYIKNNKYRYCAADQDILNVLFRKKIKCFNLKYNFNSGFYVYGIKESVKMYDLKSSYYFSLKQIKEAYDNPIVHHCMGVVTNRPWEKNNNHPQNKLFNKYLKKSPWKYFKKRKVINDKIFVIQRFLYQNLPKSIYIPIHRIILAIYLKKLANDNSKHKLST